MTDTSVTAPAPQGAFAAALSHMTTHWQTTLVGVSLLVLAGASAAGIQLPVIGGVHFTAAQLAAAGLTSLGFLVAKDSNK